MMEAVEEEARRTKKGVAVLAFDSDFWFMNIGFFKKVGYEEVARKGNAVIMLKAFEPVVPPVMHRLNYRYAPVPGKVVIDVFWTPICPSSIQEIHNLRYVCSEYSDKVILNEYKKKA